MLFWKDVRNGYCWTARSRSNCTRVTDRYRVVFGSLIPRRKKFGRVMQTSSWSLSWVIGRTSPWTEGPSITHIHSHTHYSLHFTCPVCIRKLTSTWREHTNSTLKGLVGLQYTGPHYTKLLMFIYLFICNYCFRIVLIFPCFIVFSISVLWMKCMLSE